MSDDEGDLRRETEDEEEDSDEEDDLTRRLRSATADMKKTFDGEATEDDIDQFFYQHHEVLRHVGPDGTFLHKIVQLVYEKTNDKSVSASHVKPLIDRLLKDYPHFLRTPNDEGQNPLYRAIHLKKYTWKLVDYMLDSCPDPLCIKDALERPCGKGETLKTCLTLAFEKDIKSKVIQNLVSHASEKALELKDGSGRTPFHRAVQYSQCSDERVQVIRLLLDKDREAIREQRSGSAGFRPVETFLDSKYFRKEGEIEYSVYGEHERTARSYIASEQARKEREAKMREADLERADGRTLNPAIRDREPPKAILREKDPKSQATDGGPRKPDRERERRGPEQDRIDETERRRQQLREEEQRRARGERAIPPQPPREVSSTRPFRDRPIPKLMTSHTPTDHAPNTPLKRVLTQRFDVDEEKKKQRSKKVTTTSTSKSTPKKPDSKVLAKNSTKILRMLKLHYMRTRDIKMATSFLYGKNIEDVQICFDYEGLPSEIQDHVFTERFGRNQSSGIRFDEVLMYVRFPNVTVTRTGRKARKPRALGRQDMEFFFDWLHEKGVRRILRVEVDDSGKIPHSDESIKLALDKIIVEHLDWRKTDLEPEVICRISSQAEVPGLNTEGNEDVVVNRNRLREVTLKWSGSNAVLRAWSEPEGLPRLQKLQVVNLSIPAASDLYDTRSWVQSNLDQFRTRLNKNININQSVKQAVAAPPEEESSAPPGTATPDEGAEEEPQQQQQKPATPPVERTILVTVREGKKGTEVAVNPSGGAKTSERSNPVTEHEWLNCMERFAGSMDVFWKRTLDVSRERVAANATADVQTAADLNNLKKDVVVALIDDGVDSCDSAFAGRAIEGKTFDYQDGGVGQYYISANGHGTEMARMILRVCPMASIYSIRLKTHTSPDKGQSTIDAVSAALAIEAALEKNATIISMSWTIPIPEPDTEARRLLDAVLERACRQKVLMFCSSPDQLSATSHYPSAFRRERFFLIGAAHDDGSAFGHAGKGNDFIFPGVNISTSAGGSLPAYLADKTASTKESTGSSIATALAAGLAAMVTYCFKASALAVVSRRFLLQQGGSDYAATAASELVKPGDVDRMAEHEVLRSAFTRIGRMENGQFIQVWDRFGPASRELEAETSYETKLTHIMNLCSNLIDR